MFLTDFCDSYGFAVRLISTFAGEVPEPLVKHFSIFNTNIYYFSKILFALSYF